MDFGEIGKAAIVGGLIAIVVEFVVGATSRIVALDFSFIAMLLAGFVAGWMIKGKQEDAVGAGAVAGLVFIILGVYIIYPLFGRTWSGNPVGALVVGIVLGAIAGFAGNYLVSSQKSTSRKK